MNELINIDVYNFTPKEIQEDFMRWRYSDVEEATLSNSVLVNINSVGEIYFCLI